MKEKLKTIANWIVDSTCNETTSGNMATPVEEVEEKFGVKLTEADIDAINILITQDFRVSCASDPEDTDFNINVFLDYCPCYEPWDDEEIEDVA